MSKYSGRRSPTASSMPVVMLCQGSLTRRTPSEPMASSSLRSGRSSAQSKWVRTSRSCARVAARRRSRPDGVDQLLCRDAHGLAGEHARGADAVAAHVHQPTPGRLGQQARVLGVLEHETEGCAHHAQLADRAAGDELLESQRLRMVSPHERLRQHEACGVGGREGLLHVAGHARVRLLAEDVLAGGERPQRPLVVQLVGQRDVDGVDIAIGQQRLVAPVRPVHPQLARLRLRTGELAAGDRDHAYPRARSRSRGQVRVDAGRREQPDTQRHPSTPLRAG